jgi:hypothetical protein
MIIVMMPNFSVPRTCATPLVICNNNIIAEYINDLVDYSKFMLMMMRRPLSNLFVTHANSTKKRKRILLLVI